MFVEIHLGNARYYFQRLNVFRCEHLRAGCKLVYKLIMVRHLDVFKHLNTCLRELAHNITNTSALTQTFTHTHTHFRTHALCEFLHNRFELRNPSPAVRHTVNLL